MQGKQTKKLHGVRNFDVIFVVMLSATSVLPGVGRSCGEMLKEVCPQGGDSCIFVN